MGTLDLALHMHYSAMMKRFIAEIALLGLVGLASFEAFAEDARTGLFQGNGSTVEVKKQIAGFSVAVQTAATDGQGACQFASDFASESASDAIMAIATDPQSMTKTCGLTVRYLDDNAVTVSGNDNCAVFCSNGASLKIDKATRAVPKDAGN